MASRLIGEGVGEEGGWGGEVVGTDEEAVADNEGEGGKCVIGMRLTCIDGGNAGSKKTG